MRFSNSIFAQLLKPLGRRQFRAIVERHAGDAYDKCFRSWEHLVTLVFAQFARADSLRGLSEAWNASGEHHYHVGARIELKRSTLADANGRRPPAIFAETFALLAGELDAGTRRDGCAMVRILDSTPVPLGRLCAWAKSNGRIRGMKLHVVFSPAAGQPRVLGITDANVNDAQIGRTVDIESAATYVFDKGYCHYGWWGAIHAANAFFVTRPKVNMGLEVVAARALGDSEGDGFSVLEDVEVRFASKGDSRLPMRLRRISLLRHQGGGRLVILTNDLERSAVAIGALYKRRWQIELLFRWIKQHLNIRRFLGNNDNAIRLQIMAAMIAFALLRIAARASRIAVSLQRFAELVSAFIFARRSLAAIEKPPPVNPSQRKDRSVPNQISFAYA